jgi:hypothetical protein
VDEMVGGWRVKGYDECGRTLPSGRVGEWSNGRVG